MAFQLCTNYRQRDFKPKISIETSGVLRFNEILCKQFKIFDCKYIRFYVDIKEKLIGFERMDKTDDHVIPITKSRCYRAKPLLSSMKLNFKDYIGQYLAHKEPESVLIYFDLKQPLK